ncbi:MAG: hypothetical protein AAF682_20705 [Planctomycetota bacterium]
MEKQSSRVEFVESHRPALLSGDYRIEVSQRIGASSDAIPAETSFPPKGPLAREFSVRGPRFTLLPADVHSAFPPPASHGEHHHTLPHVALERGTLPWERSARPDAPAFPWLVLLLFDDRELVSGDVRVAVPGTLFRDGFRLERGGSPDDPSYELFREGTDANVAAQHPEKLAELIELLEASGTTLADLQSPGAAHHPPLLDREAPDIGVQHLRLERGESLSDEVSILDVRKSLLDAQLPLPEDLPYLAHVRQKVLFELGAEVEVGLNELDASVVGEVLGTHGIEVSGDATLTPEEFAPRWRLEDREGAGHFLLKPRKLHVHVLSEDGRPLFDLQPELAAALESLQVTDALREAFRREGRELSDTAQLNVEQPAPRWRLEDPANGRSFHIKRRSTRFEVFNDDEGGHLFDSPVAVSAGDPSLEVRAIFARHGFPLAAETEAREVPTAAGAAASEWLLDDPERTYRVKETTFDVTDGSELALVLGNRLPRAGSTSNVHLVSVEGRYDADGFHAPGAKARDFIRLVSLRSWRFSCAEPFRITNDLLDELRADAGVPDPVVEALEQLKDREITAAELDAALETAGDALRQRILHGARSERHTFRGLLRHLDREPATLRLPPSSVREGTQLAATTALALGAGQVLLPHRMRGGETSFSWYRGPLTPSVTSQEVALPVRAADELVRYDPVHGVFDVSYASAWELGRLLLLRDKGASISVFQWKRDQALHARRVEQASAHPHLHGELEAPSSDVPAQIATWFRRLGLLHGVPFRYLVPDDRMLPKESIRFFRVDRPWVEALLDGAFSVGRTLRGDVAREESHLLAAARPVHPVMTGVLLRSAVVSGWPGLQVDAYSVAPPDQQSERFELPDEDRLALLRMERLSPNVLLCLFEGGARVVDVHLQPQTLHFGLDVSAGAQPSYTKQLRDGLGRDLNLEVDSVPLRSPKEPGQGGVVAVAELVRNMERSLAPVRDTLPAPLPVDWTSAEFALQMIEGVDKVRFLTG